MEWTKETEIDDPFTRMSSYFRNIFRFINEIQNIQFHFWRMSEWKNKRIYEWMKEEMNEWKNEGKNEGKNDWINE